MKNVDHACKVAVARELDFFNAIMSRARRKPFQKARSWRLVDGGIDALAARSWRARIVWTKAIIQTLYDHFEVTEQRPKPNTPIRHLTLAIDEFTVPKGERLPTERLKDMLKWIPRHWNVFGCFEAAYFRNISPLPGIVQPVFSWHAHMFVWGVPLSEIEATVQEINRNVQGLGELDAAFITGVDDDLFQVKGSYLFKPPRKDYHLTRPYITKDGEVKRRVRGRLAGPANCVRSWRELKNRSLPELTFGRREGARVRRNVKQRAEQLLTEARGLCVQKLAAAPKPIL